MLNEELTKETIESAKGEVKEASEAAKRFAFQYFIKPTAQMLVASLKKVVTLPYQKLHPEHGEMPIKDLIRKDQGAQAIDIDGMGLGEFRKIANKYGVDFAIVKSTELDPPKYSVFFKARDADAINAVVNEYTARMMNIQKGLRPSILEKLKKFKDIVAALPKKLLEKRKEQSR